MNAPDARRLSRLRAAILPLLVPMCGCADGALPSASAPVAAVERSAPGADAFFARSPDDAPAEAPKAGGAASVPAAMPRKIIYNGYIDLVVEDFSAVEAKLTALLEAQGGYVSETNVTGSPGSQRSGSWKVRVPAERFAPVMTSLAKLGELRSNRTDSQDVSQEYYDLEARISVKKQEEKRLLKILEEAAGKLKDILDVEKELSRVRSETEQMEGRLRWLAHNTALSTISVSVTEIKNYKPPVAPTFAQRIVRRFQASTESLGEFLMNTTLTVVAIIPWLVVIVPVTAVAWLAARVWGRGRTARAA